MEMYLKGVDERSWACGFTDANLEKFLGECGRMSIGTGYDNNLHRPKSREPSTVHRLSSCVINNEKAKYEM